MYKQDELNEMLRNEFKDLTDEQIKELRSAFLGQGRYNRCSSELIRRRMVRDGSMEGPE